MNSIRYLLLIVLPLILFIILLFTINTFEQNKLIDLSDFTLKTAISYSLTVTGLIFTSLSILKTLENQKWFEKLKNSNVFKKFASMMRTSIYMNLILLVLSFLCKIIILFNIYIFILIFTCFISIFFVSCLILFIYCIIDFMDILY